MGTPGPHIPHIPGNTGTPGPYFQWRIQDFGKRGSFTGCRRQPQRAGRVALISPREAREKFSPLFFSYQGGLSWHLRALHSKFQM